jgi:hypothetical protein
LIYINVLLLAIGAGCGLGGLFALAMRKPRLCTMDTHRWRAETFPIPSFAPSQRIGMINRCSRCGVQGAYLGEITTFHGDASVELGAQGHFNGMELGEAIRQARMARLKATAGRSGRP